MFVQRKASKNVLFLDLSRKWWLDQTSWKPEPGKPEVSVTKITMKVGSRVGIGFALTHFIQAAVGDLGWLATSGDTIFRHKLFSALSPLLCLISKVKYIALELPIVRQMSLKRTKVIKSIFGQNLTSSWGSFRHQSMDGRIPKNWNKNNNEEKEKSLLDRCTQKKQIKDNKEE